jgi:hypothetical protein
MRRLNANSVQQFLLYVFVAHNFIDIYSTIQNIQANHLGITQCMNFINTIHTLYLFLHSLSVILKSYLNKQARSTSRSWPLSFNLLEPRDYFTYHQV